MSLKSLHDPQRKKRAIIVYSISLILLASLSVYLLWSLRSLLLPFIVGGLLAYVCKPLLQKFKYSWLPQPIRVFMLLSLIIGSIFYVTRMIKDQIPTEKEQHILEVRLQYKVNQKYKELMGIDPKTNKGNFIYEMTKQELTPFMSSLNNLLSFDKEQMQKFESYEAIPENFQNYYAFNKENFYQKTKTKNKAISQVEKNNQVETESTIAKVFHILSSWLLMPFVFLFLLFDRGQINKFLIKVTPNRYFELTLTLFEQVDRAIGKYLRGTLLECSLVGLTLGLGLFLIGIDVNIAIIIGLVAGLANAIPFLGPFIGLVVGLSYALIVENIDPIIPFVTPDNLFIGVFIVVAIAQVLDNVIYQPIVLGSAVNLHPLVVVIGVMGGSILFGFAGMLLAIPTIVICKVVVENLFVELKAYKII